MGYHTCVNSNISHIIIILLKHHHNSTCSRKIVNGIISSKICGHLNLCYFIDHIVNNYVTSWWCVIRITLMLGQLISTWRNSFISRVIALWYSIVYDEEVVTFTVEIVVFALLSRPNPIAVFWVQCQGFHSV